MLSFIDRKYRILIVGNPGKCGSSTIVARLVNGLNAKQVHTGGYMRAEALKARCILPEHLPSAEPTPEMADLLTFRRRCKEIGRNIDAEMDIYCLSEMLQALESDQVLVVDSKMAARLSLCRAGNPLISQIRGIGKRKTDMLRHELASQTCAVWLTANLRTRAERLLSKAYPGSVIAEAEIKKAMQQLWQRQQDDAADYRFFYGVKDYPIGDRAPKRRFGTVIDSTNKSVEETYAEVLRVFGLVEGLLSLVAELWPDNQLWVVDDRYYDRNGNIWFLT